MKTTGAVLPCVATCLLRCALHADVVPRVAVWDPETPASHPRVNLQAEQLDRAAASWRRSGVAVARLTAEQIADASRFDASRFDLVVFSGEVFPGIVLPTLRTFAESGGVVMNLGGKIPLVNRIARRADGTWTVAPETPAFAWQTDEVLGLFGVRYVYSPPHHDLARRFTATPLLRRYVPGAGDLAGMLENWWLPTVTVDGATGEYYPLIRSQRVDGVDVTPQVAIVRAGKRHAILCLNPLFTVGTKPELWRHADELLKALARIACDLRSGALRLTPDQRVDVPADLPPPLPLRTCPDTPGAVPEAMATATVAQFGRFNDSSLDLDAGPLPATLAPGATATLPLPSLTGEPLCLRIRGAYAAGGAALRAEIGGRTILHESFLMPDASGASNLSSGLYDNSAAPLLRLVFVPPSPGADRLVFSNPGTEPFHFDAVRLERRVAPAPLRWIGQYAGFRTSMPDGVNTIPTNITHRWSVLRCDLRGQFAGPPGDPKRWDTLKRHLDKFAAMSSRWNLILMGTPEWAAISPERYAQGKRDGRPHCVPPDAAKYAEVVEWVVANYGTCVALYEIWNEADIRQFWRGTTDEYLAFAEAMMALLRKIAPGTPTILAGPAGIHAPYLNAVLPSPLSRSTGLVPLHPYAGQSVGWDIPYGLLQGMLYAHGLDQEICCNESGFVWKPAEWFRDPSWSPRSQARALSAAMGRLLATDLAKLTLFLAGGDEHHFGVYDAEGRPRPAAAVIEDYLTLALDDGRRAAIALASRDGAALEGVYAAAASHADGSLTIVANPAEAAALQPPPDSVFDTAERHEWTTFRGESEWREGTVRIMPDAGRDYCGFYRRTLLNPALHPEVEVTVAEAAGRWTLQLKFGDGDDPLVFAEEGAGTFRAEYTSRLRNRAPRPVEISFRATRPLTLDGIRFPAAPWRLGVRLAFPLSGDGDWRATATKTGQDVPVRLDLHGTGAQRWAEASLDLTGRTVVRVGRATSAAGR
jgi:hypothetical protein